MRVYLRIMDSMKDSETTDVKNFTRSQPWATKFQFSIYFKLKFSLFTFGTKTIYENMPYTFMALTFHENRGDWIKR